MGKLEKSIFYQKLLMSKNSDLARFEFILEMISDIGFIIFRHGSAKKALEDVEGHHALLMCLQQIGESLNKIGNVEYRKKLPVDLAYTMRNVIAHDYLGINLKIVEQTIDIDIPELADKFKSLV